MDKCAAFQRKLLLQFTTAFSSFTFYMVHQFGWYISQENIMTIFIVQKNTRRLTFSEFQGHTTLIVRNFETLKLQKTLSSLIF